MLLALPMIYEEFYSEDEPHLSDDILGILLFHHSKDLLSACFPISSSHNDLFALLLSHPHYL